MMIRKFLLLLLMVAVVGLGVAQARADLCPPDCGHCQVVKVTQPDRHSCCEEQGEVTVVPQSPDADGLAMVPGCDHGLSCLAANQQQDSLTGLSFSVLIAFSLVLPDGGPAFPRLAGPSAAFRPQAPPLRRAPDLFTRNCSFLI